MRNRVEKTIFTRNPDHKIADLFRKIRICTARLIKPKPTPLEKAENWMPIRVPIAGVMVNNHFVPVSELSLLEKVFLFREPENPYDRNAIQIRRADGKRLGYVGRIIAENLSPYMDQYQNPIEGLVTEITSDISGNAIGASICFYLPKDVYSKVCCKEDIGIDYCIEETNNGAAYLYINCDEAKLNQLHDFFKSKNAGWVRSGLSNRPAANGIQYRWYIRFEGINSESIDGYLQQELAIIPLQARTRKELNDYAQTFDSENETLKQMIQELTQKNEQLQDCISDLEKSRSKKWSQEISDILKAFLPSIELKRDSLDVITYELKDYQQIFRVLHVISCRPEQLKGTSVQNAPGWLEKHFSTGEKDDGRIYYKKVGDKWAVLISVKKSQLRDIDWLKNN